MILRGVFVFYIWRGLYVEKEDPGLEGLVVSYISKVEIPVSSYL